MAMTTKRGGNPIVIDYTPSGGDVAAGDVVVLGNTTSPTCGIAPVAIVNGTLGALEVGGSIVDAVNLNNSADYALVYWDDSTNKVTSVSTNNQVFGFVVGDGGGGANSTARVLHDPRV